MKFEFGKYTDITQLYKKYSDALQEGDHYFKFYICLDVRDIWLIRVMKDINEEYEHEEGVFLLERNNIEKANKSDNLTLSKVINIIKEDDFSNWDIKEYHDLEELIDDIDGEWGIN